MIVKTKMNAPAMPRCCEQVLEGNNCCCFFTCYNDFHGQT